MGVRANPIDSELYVEEAHRDIPPLTARQHSGAERYLRSQIFKEQTVRDCEKEIWRTSFLKSCLCVSFRQSPRQSMLRKSDGK